ncbi:DUF441 domain-containing protein [Effusibacillus lacus]|uniref:UPF0756 membrane protein EFBL_2219 n=1 Tax=Effusibacillus lacus TaxID=1348429 RepID=A0A292YDU3_9BACL|nr:DUF441 domain-containing protein [Effusibacillus lacus]TCS73190.1 uncharacterized membrane protein (DUF441 family) [Effusibacillus lacus]GAX90592.1 DUF441 family protein [Effusibacillus lacus]
MDQTNVILLVLLTLGIIGNNTTVSIAVSALLLLRLLHLERVFPTVENYGLQAGIVILTIGVLSPLASGKIGTDAIVTAIKNPVSVIGILAGILVAYLGGKGIPVLTEQPLIVTGILIGTIIGVSLFKGVPVGPLIAAGGVGLILQFFQGK